MSFETPAESLPPVFDANNVAYTHPFSWGSWSVTEQANTAYGLTPAVRPQEASAVEPDGYTPINIALLGPEEITSLLPQPAEPWAGSLQLGASDNLENPWIVVGVTGGADLGRDYMGVLLHGQSKEDLAQARLDGHFPIEQFIMQGVGDITMRVAAKESARDQAQVSQRFKRGAIQTLAAGMMFTADIASTLVIPDKPYITFPLGMASLGATLLSARRVAGALEDSKRATDKVVEASTFAAARALVAANNIHNIYAPTRED